MPRPEIIAPRAVVAAALLVAACDAADLTRPVENDPFGLVPPPPPSSPLGPFASYAAPTASAAPPPPKLVSHADLVSEPPPPTSSDRPHAESSSADITACPAGMVLVHGDFCVDAREDCVRWMDDPGPFEKKRCAEFAKPSRCVSGTKHLRFCIDETELAKQGDDLPLGDLSWTLAREQCESRGKRLCLESEWTFACEGEAMFPYPTGFVRDPHLCNYDRTTLVDRRGKMIDYRAAASQFPACKSPFGALEMVGNVDEWVWRDLSSGVWRSALKGGWWLAGRNRCRPATTGHDELYHDMQAGTRCCKDAR